MATKWKSIKPAVAFLAFLGGITLLCYGIAAIVTCGVQMGWNQLVDAFRSDYQDTAAFRREIEYDLEWLLEYAASGDTADLEPVESSPLEPDLSPWEQPSATTEVPLADSATAAVAETQAPSPMATPALSETATPLPGSQNDFNLLYAVWADGHLVVSNTSGLSLDGELPQGYNFRLTFDGSAVSIKKDGGELDLYGDGYYRPEDGDWDVPGYRNRPVAEEYADITLCLIAAAEPVLYSGAVQYGGLYQVAQDLHYERTVYFWLLLFPAGAGLFLLLWSILWRRHKVRADQAIAWFTGHIWLEIKLLLLIPLAFCGAVAVVSCVNLFYYSVIDSFFSIFAALILLWSLYFYLNDLHYNFGQLRTHSFCAACARILCRQELHWSIQQRMDRRAVLQFVFCIPFFLLAALQIPRLYSRTFYSGLGPLMLFLLCLAGAALIGAQIWLMGRNRRTTAELDRLLTQVEAAGNGRLEEQITPLQDPDLREVAAQLAHMESGLRTALEEQMKSERMKVELIANVSHDLKTPLTSIISYTELLSQEEGLPDHVQDYIRILCDKSRRLQTMVRDVFEVSKAATGNLSVVLKPLDFAKLLRQTLADRSEAIESSALTLKARLPEEPVWILADGDRLYRVFQNLIDNALKYSLEGSRIYLDLTCVGGQAQAAIRNTSRDELPDGVDLTERFVRGDASRSDGGSGLGLSIARTFTEACGGTFSVLTQADLFTALVCFPLTDVRPEEPELSPGPTPPLL